MTKTNPTFTSPDSDLFPEDAPAADSNSTRKTYLKRSRSGYTKIRSAFVQVPPSTARAGSKPAMLPAFARNHRAAVLYLAVLRNWTWLARSDEALPADTWIRFLKSDKPNALTWTTQSLSHAWKVLEENRLVTRKLENRLKKVTPLQESGSGSGYTSPDGSRSSVYFVLPDEFWTQELHATLSWPELAVLLILLKESSGRPWAELSIDRAQKYYGISRSTAEEGLRKLRDKGFLTSKDRYVTDPDAAEGRRLTSLHVLVDPFSMKYRQGLQEAARERRDANSAALTSTEAEKKKTNKKPKKPREVVNDEQSEEAKA
ncbi:hypothetical protein LJR042_000040 [Microbacterium maritypicum]|uniref:hypothetical protein n=1 Tax=Microbacterium TaxID=33882 RepID=UPI00141FA21E|nr:hypothetical protein [Microbacterium sp. Be9]NIG65224.1 hypothetical protein [Microbacterium sp. Be9]